MLIQEVKATYYPQLLLRQTETRFGSMKLLSQNNPYDSPLPNHTRKMLIKCDKLECFKALWGEGILVARDNIYILVSGDSDDITYKGILCSYYKTHSKFAKYIDELVYYGNTSLPLILRITRAFRNELNAYKSTIVSALSSLYGTKFLLEDKEYMYYAVDSTEGLTLSGVEVIK